MQNNTPLRASGGQNTKSKRAKRERKQAKWTLLNLLSTWFLTSEGKAVIVDPTVENGASHDNWRELVQRTNVPVPPDHLAAPWGQLSRRDFLNWCEDHLPEDRRPQLFGSKEDALDWWDFSRQFERDFDGSETASKRFEILKVDDATPQDDGDDTPPNGAA